MNNKERMGRVLFDFDGTICEFDFPNIGNPKWNIFKAAHRFKALGFEIIVWSGRTSRAYTEDVWERVVLFSEMKRFLDQTQFPYDWLDDGTYGKIPADYVIDDTCLPAESEIINQLLKKLERQDSVGN